MTNKTYTFQIKLWLLGNRDISNHYFITITGLGLIKLILRLSNCHKQQHVTFSFKCVMLMDPISPPVLPLRLSVVKRDH